MSLGRLAEGDQQQQPPPQAMGRPLVTGTFWEQAPALQAWTYTLATPFAHSALEHIPTWGLQRSAVVSVPTLIVCSMMKQVQNTL
jgi:hypothetical protein